MISSLLQTQFNNALQTWRETAMSLAEAENDYAKAYAKAVIGAPGKNEGERKAAADLATDKERFARDLRRVAERAARIQLDFIVRQAGAPSGESEAA